MNNDQLPVSRAPGSHSASPGGAIKRRRRLLGSAIALIVLLALGGLVWYRAHRQPAGGAAGMPGLGRGGPPATTVGVAKAKREDVPVLLEALGTVTPIVSSIVRPQVSGVLQKVLFQEGQFVKAGQLLAVIDPRPFELALLEATGQRQRDEAQLENAKLTLQRYQTLLSQDSIARQDVDTQETLVKQLQGTLAADKAAEGTARLNLGYSRIVAPISGRVGLRVVDIGNVVSSGDADGIAVITQLSPIDVVFSVPQDQVGEVQGASAAGAAPVTALDRSRLGVLEEGQFLTLDNRVDTQTGTVKAKARFANAQSKLFPNQFVNVRLRVRTLKDMVVVPVAALRNGSSGDYVYVLDRGARTVAMRAVKRDRSSFDKVAIRSGLKAGEEVITDGADRLKDGAKVNLPGDAPRAGGKGQARPGESGGRRRAEAASAASGPASRAASSAVLP